ncbi:MAG: hypothetical protein WDW36_005856 [Sanguina aurantia]
MTPLCCCTSQIGKTPCPPCCSNKEVKSGNTVTENISKALKEGMAGMVDLGPIGMTFGADPTPEPRSSSSEPEPNKQSRPAVPGSSNSSPQKGSQILNSSGLALGPIGLSFGQEFGTNDGSSSRDSNQSVATPDDTPMASISSLTTEQWRAKYENKDGAVDLWLEDEYNAGSRLVGGRAVHTGGMAGFRTGEGTTAGDVAVHSVKIFDHYANQEITVQVPEDRYILWEAEDKGLDLPNACRMGCCTRCAVRIKEGEMYQPEALGISAELRAAGYGLMCVGFPSSDLVLETVSEDEVYELQFGESFASQALDPLAGSIDRDDFALGIANMDE